MKVFFDNVDFYAAFYTKDGVYIGKKEFKETDKYITFQNNKYFVQLSCKTFFRLPNYTGPIFTGFSKFYFYHLDNPEPLEFIENYSPLLTAEELGVVIDTTKLKELHDLANENKFLTFITKLLKSPIFWIILIVLLVGFFYFSKRGFKLW